jgi:hypothetical protein
MKTMHRGRRSALKNPWDLRWLVSATALLLLVGTLGACARSKQLQAVKEFNEEAPLVRIACLDLNDDGRIDAVDADPTKLPDLTGDGKVDGDDAALVSELSLPLPEGRPDNCNKMPEPDWQVTSPPAPTCAPGEAHVLVMGVGGGVAELAEIEHAAGARWMVTQLGNLLDAVAVPKQLASVAPAVHVTDVPHATSEAWSVAFISFRLNQDPCLYVTLLGHSHGGAWATAVASRLEEGGFGQRILLTALIDRVTYLYSGDTASIPQTSPVLNIYLANGEALVGQAFNQPNVENWDATDVMAPAEGEEGGPLEPARHTTIDNSDVVLQAIGLRMLGALCQVKSC